MKNMKLKLSFIIVILAGLLFSSCRSRKWSCKNRYAKNVIDSAVKEVDKCYLVLESNDTLYNIPKEYVFSEGDSYKFVVLERYNFKCQIVQKDLIDLRV